MTIGTHDAGRRIAAKYGFSMFDGLIAASALEAECDTLYSEDLQHGQIIEGRVTIRNPFQWHRRRPFASARRQALSSRLSQ